MSENGTHPLKPKTEWCRRSALKKWKGWTNDVIASLVLTKLLPVKRFKPLRHNPTAKHKQKLGRRLYHVPTAEEL